MRRANRIFAGASAATVLYIAPLAFCIPAMGQDPDNAKIVMFDRTDVEHCKVEFVGGMQLLETEYGGTRVAVGLPAGMVNGVFRVYVSVGQIAVGRVKVNPKEFSAYYSDPAHTRFPYYEEPAEIAPEMTKASSGNDPWLPGTTPPPGTSVNNTWSGASRSIPAQDPSASARHDEQTREKRARVAQQNTAVLDPSEFLGRRTVQRGKSVAGFVSFRRPEGSKLTAVGPDVLYQVDIPINGIIFRYR
jgi:hypothetical protein